MNKETFNKFNNYMTQHTDKVPLLSVQSVEDKRFNVLREFLSQCFDDVEDNAWSVSMNLGKFVDSLSTMEQSDRDALSRLVSKYEVKGTSSGISGERRYGYDAVSTRVEKFVDDKKKRVGRGISVLPPRPGCHYSVSSNPVQPRPQPSSTCSLGVRLCTLVRDYTYSVIPDNRELPR